MMFDFQHQLKILPDKPGVYIMKNSLGEVIYVGKAKVLKNRVRQYFQNSKNHSEKVRAMVKNIAEFEYIVTDSEMEALILECNLIKKYSPRYNIALKDDKFYPFIKITTNEDFPRVYVTRNFAKDGNRYFGPYTNGTAVYEVMGLIKKLFPLRTCKKAIVEGGEPTRACLNYHINLCKAPCAGYISKAEYWEMIDEIINILNGTDTSIIKNLKLEMEKAAEELEFEKAAKIRDRILAIELISEKQKMFTVKEGDEDFIDLYTDEKDGCAQVFFVREGKVTGREHFMIEDIGDDPVEEVISSFIASFYGGTAQIPKTIYVPEEIEDQELIEKFLTEKRGSKVWIKVPKKGDKKNLLDMVRNNAKIMLDQFKEKMVEEKELNKSALTELADVLGLDSLPARIEAYDISNIQGVDSVGTMVVFENGKAKNSDYRRFKIKSVKGPNDYESMREILSRRFSHGLEEVNKIKERNLEYSKGKFCIFPDLIMMDGGKGQVNIALEVLKDFGIEIPVCGLVKDDKHRTKGLISQEKEIELDKTSNLYRFVASIQEEVHNYAISYHRSLRNKSLTKSVLDDIQGIGQKRKKALLSKFKSIEEIKMASLEDLLEVEGMNKSSAENVFKFFNNK